MAKNKRNEGATSLINKLKKNSKVEATSVFADSDFYTEIEYIPTPIPLINLALSGKFFDGGISKGVTILAGASRSGKTIFMLLCLKAYLDKFEDAVGLLYDSEFSFTPSYLNAIGIDTNRVVVTPLGDLEDFKIDLINQLNGIEVGEHVFVGVDSLGSFYSSKEFSDALDGKEKTDMTRQKSMKSIMRMVVPESNIKKIPFFAITHSYETLEIYSKTVVSGGTGLMYAANTVLLFSRRKIQSTNEEGYEFVIKIEKSRSCKDTIKLPLVAPRNGTFKKWSSLYDLAVEYGYINNGSWVTIPCLAEYEDKKVRRKEIEDNDEFWKKMFTETNMVETIEKYFAVSQDQTSIFDDIEEEADDLINAKSEDYEID